MGMVISAAYVLRNAYSGNGNFKSSGFRANSNNHDVVKADRRAMERALDRLDNLDFDSTEENDTKSIYNTVTTYLDIYNNTIESTKSSASGDIQKTASAMKKLMKEHEDELGDIGITIKSDGSVKIDKKELQKATTKQVAKIFSNKSGHISDMKALMKKLRSKVNREVPVQDMPAEDGSTFSARV